MYEKLSPKQQNGLIYGSRKRCIGAVQGLLGSTLHRDDVIAPFTAAELQTIQEICTNAQNRAKETYERVCRELAEADANKRPEAEHRQYNGK